MDVDPRGVEPYNGLMAESAEEMDLGVHALQRLRCSQNVAELRLVPRHLNPVELVECSEAAETSVKELMLHNPQE